jgi:hypothetical protein
MSEPIRPYFPGSIVSFCMLQPSDCTTLINLASGRISNNRNEVQRTLEKLPESCRNEIYGRIWSLAGEPEGDPQWGQNHALDDLNRLSAAVHQFAGTLFDSLATPQRNFVAGRVYSNAGSPQTDDRCWGEHHAKDNSAILLESISELASVSATEAIYMIIDAWIREAPNESRIHFKNQIIRVLNREITSIKCSGDNLSSLPDIFGFPSLANTITDLNLSDNQLTALPESFGKLRALQTLNLFNNQLTALPESFGQLQALQTLTMDVLRE